MKNVDIARETFDARGKFNRVIKQQGRVELESDWNEQTSILLRTLRVMMMDLIGSHGGPRPNCAFRVIVPTAATHPASGQALLGSDPEGDFGLSAGRYYVDGILCEVDAPFRYREQPAGRRAPLMVDGWHLVYLVVWERAVTALQYPGIREVALGGDDTSARGQTVWEVRTTEVAAPAKGDEYAKNDLEGWRSREPHPRLEIVHPRLRSLMSARARHHGTHDAADDGTSSWYRGPENQLYLIEIHRPGEVGVAVPTFKWSRDNGSVAFAVERIEVSADDGLDVTLASLGRDETSTLSFGDRVDFEHDASPDRPVDPHLYEVTGVDDDMRLVTLRRIGHAMGSTPSSPELERRRRLVLRRWDQRVQPSDDRPESFDGAIPIVENRWIQIEDGIEVRFDSPKGETTHGYRRGDYWQFAARVDTGDVEWPRDGGQPTPRPPQGLNYHVAPLALIKVHAGIVRRSVHLQREFEP